MFYLKVYSFLLLCIVLVSVTCKQIPFQETLFPKKQEELTETVVFVDNDHLLQIELEKNYVYQLLDQNTEKHYFFEWYQDLQENKKKLLYKLEIHIFSKESELFSDVLQPGYEINFLKTCKCKMIQKSWIYIQKKNAREYEYQINPYTFLSLHFHHRNFLIQIQASSEDYVILLNFWKKFKQTIVLGEKDV